MSVKSEKADNRLTLIYAIKTVRGVAMEMYMYMCINQYTIISIHMYINYTCSFTIYKCNVRIIIMT